MIKTLVRKIYSLLPFKKQVFTLLKLFYTPPECIYRHLHFKGVFRVAVGNSSFKIVHYGYQIENELFWGGINNAWEKQSLNIWVKLCRTSDVIFDLGANTGIYSLVAKAVSPNAKIYSFEPVKRICERLKENIAINGYDITAVEKAASSTDGTAIIYDTASEHVYAVTVNENRSPADTKVTETKIQTITLDTFIRENNIEKLDLIKIDVETHEPQVLEGFSHYLSKFRPAMIIEILSDEIGAAVQDSVKNLDYLYFNISEKGGVRRVDTILKSDSWNYLLCDFETAVYLGLITGPSAYSPPSR